MQMNVNKRYQIIKELGRGSFGITYQAKDLKENRFVALKELMPQFNDPSLLETAQRLFKKEAEVLKELGKNGIPELYDYFEINQKFYLAQEYIKGDTLTKEIVPGEPLPETEVIKLLKEILEVLSIVHQNGTIHRDIKPLNIMRRTSDKKIFLIDFGAVKQITTSSAYSQTVTIGTEGYMPKEQREGYPKLSSDVYAVGMLSIQALTGIYPTVLIHQNNQEIIWKDRVKVTKEFARILDKMIAQKYGDRFPNAEEALQAIQQLNKPKKTKKAWLILSVIGIIALIGFILFWTQNKQSCPTNDPNLPSDCKY